MAGQFDSAPGALVLRVASGCGAAREQAGRRFALQWGRLFGLYLIWYSAGRIVWEFNTVQDFVTVGGGTARGGSMGGSAGQLAWHGTLVVPSGYAFSGRMGGNVLLVFGVE